MTDRHEGDRAREKLVELLQDVRIGMLTTYGAHGPRSLPMARQEVEPSAQMWFLTGRDTRHVRDVEAEPRVSLTFTARDAWIAIAGRATVVDDRAKVEELWNTFAEAWMPEGPEDPNAVLLRVDVEEAEYWDSPGGTVASLLSFVKAKVTGDTLDADHGTVRP
ncbi:MAG TPA: pyridoxamine 5'-phosphate oxidase family protein [Nocardioides sp.]|nr:pyridoxamine 5'-phosphate oxidase family protein [Nocardioides sp.]